MKTFQFKTNISCSACVSAITPYFQRTNKFSFWKVDLNHPDKVLVVQGETITAETVIELVEEAGFAIKEEIK